ncbi:MAG: metal-dependent hydrolase [Verrucomicrobiae bacterium]|nr:metal-dependent hydrolase [Verrucomicrobiae bacterium]
MSPLAHLVGSWLVAVATTTNPRDRKLVTLAGVLPDADGLGAVVDVVGSAISGKENSFHYYQQYHHILLHGWPGAIAVSVVLMFFARQHWRVFLLCLLTFHLHLLCDLVGSRGPDYGDFWPICYSEPLFRHPIWFWKHQWRLDGWQNLTLFALWLAAALWLAVKRGHSFVEMLGERADKIFVQALRKWFRQPVP